jgi:hypothetical protein
METASSADAEKHAVREKTPQAIRKHLNSNYEKNDVTAAPYGEIHITAIAHGKEPQAAQAQQRQNGDHCKLQLQHGRPITNGNQITHTENYSDQLHQLPPSGRIKQATHTPTNHLTSTAATQQMEGTATQKRGGQATGGGAPTELHPTARDETGPGTQESQLGRNTWQTGYRYVGHTSQMARNQTAHQSAIALHYRNRNQSGQHSAVALHYRNQHAPGVHRQCTMSQYPHPM